MVKYLTKKCKQKRGFTLMEVMVVVAILAVIVMIAVPSVISMRKNMQFTQCNDYAKSIFMAAQSNLTEMRSTGQLERLTTLAEKKAQDASSYGAPSGYHYTFPTGAANALEDTYNLVLPVNSIDSTIRDEQVIIEYNPKAGIVYSVFYYEGDDGELLSMYTGGSIDRNDEDKRKEQLVGYYSVGSVDALEAQELNVYRIATSLTYTNAQEGTVTVMIPTQSTENSKITNIYEDKIGGISNYVQRMEIALTFTGENSGTFRTIVKEKDTAVTYTAKDIPGVSGASTIIHIDFPLDSLKSGGSFTEIAENTEATATGGTAPAIAPGDNVSITAEVTFYPDADDPIVMIESATLAGINPMYHSLTQNPSTENGAKPYILAVSNGRHLQNLNHLDADFAQQIDSIVFVAQTEEDTVTNSGSNSDNTEGSQNPSTPSESAGDSAKTKTATDSSNAAETVGTEIVINWSETSSGSFTPIDLSKLSYVPEIIGNGVQIKNLNISTSGNYTGLFASLSGTSVSGITLMDPVVTGNYGSNADETSADKLADKAATGALVGKATAVTLTDCHVKSTAGENAADTGIVTGNYAIGGLVGYATGGTALEKCSSSITVIGDNATKNNLGGLVGQADKEVTFTKCTSEAAVSCEANEEAVYTEKNASLSNVGGMVGYGSAVTITGASVNLTQLPEYAGDAGGLAGYLTGSTIEGTTSIELTSADSDTTVYRFGGIVGAAVNLHINSKKSENTVVAGPGETTVIINGTIGNAHMAAGAAAGLTTSYVYNVTVVLNGTSSTAPAVITGAQAAGFAIEASGTIDNCRVTPAETDSNYSGKGNSLALVNGTADSAGFIVVNSAAITNSFALGTVTGGNTSGFAKTNNASIERCMANVSVPSGNAFVNTNTGTVKYCYGWVSDNGSSSALTIAERCSYSYFVNTYLGKMVLYEGLHLPSNSTDENQRIYSTPSENITDTEALTDDWALELLNNSSSKPTASSIWVDWYTGGLDEHPYTSKGDYPYPMLNGLDHYGDWAAPNSGDYPYVLRYVETYTDDTSSALLMTFSNKNTDNERTLTVSGQLDDSKEIKDTTYYLCRRTTDDLKNDYVHSKYGEDGFADEVTKFTSGSTNIVSRLYTIYELPAGNSYSIGNGEGVQTYFPLVDKDTCRIRTAEQFGYIGKVSAADFVLERSISLAFDSSYSDAILDTFSSTLSASNGATITIGEKLTGNLIGTLKEKGTLSGLTVTGLKAPMVGTVSGGTITGCNVTANITSGTNVGVIAGTMSSGSISNVTASGSVSGSGNVGGAIGEVTGGTVSDVTVNVSVSASGDNAKAGMFVGYAESGTFNKCSASDENSAFPFANFPARQTSISDKAEYVSIYNHTANSDSTPPTAPMYLTADRFSMAAIEDTNLTLITSDVSVTSCKLNGTLVSITPVYYYSISELKCAIESYMTVITTEERDPSFDSVDTSETGYYIYISEDNYAKITSTNIKEETDAEGNTTYSFSYRTENMTDEASDIVINNISSKSDKVSKYGLKLYRRTVNTPSKDTYLLFDSTGDNILIHNENGYSWEKYSEITKYYSHMVWSYKDGVFTNEYDSTTVTIGDPTSSKTYNITYDGKTVESRLYPVDAYQTVTLEDTANAFNTSLSK